jgi:hypothetical protein
MGTWMVGIDRVRECLRRLLAQRIHPNFAGYLCLKRTSHALGRLDDLSPDFQDFFNTFLAVPGGPFPYYRPFWHQHSAEPMRAWVNQNVAGSYAPSSLRPTGLLQVADIVGAGTAARYSLKANHPDLALQHLLYKVRLPVLDLAAYLYRDYAVVSDPAPSVFDLVNIFAEEFGYANTQDEWALLYEGPVDGSGLEGWFEAAPDG